MQCSQYDSLGSHIFICSQVELHQCSKCDQYMIRPRTSRETHRSRLRRRWKPRGTIFESGPPSCSSSLQNICRNASGPSSVSCKAHVTRSQLFRYSRQTANHLLHSRWPIRANHCSVRWRLLVAVIAVLYNVEVPWLSKEGVSDRILCLGYHQVQWYPEHGAANANIYHPRVLILVGLCAQ
ncbi:hypothetical protein BDW22DRAFT_597141 [Trametopsis cervina]|nr:hypothetical protein BDW22DRAFT_597141 [Trametopsis cervina]